MLFPNISLLLSVLISDNRMLLLFHNAQSMAWDILLVLTSVAGNLCNKCPNGYSNKTAVKVILSMRSLVSIKQQSPRKPCDILVANVGPEVAKIARSFLEKLQLPGALTVPRDILRRSTWPYSPPAHRNCAQAEKLHICSV